MSGGPCGWKSTDKALARAVLNGLMSVCAFPPLALWPDDGTGKNDSANLRRQRTTTSPSHWLTRRTETNIPEATNDGSTIE